MEYGNNTNQWAKGGFCKCGIVPFKPESVPILCFHTQTLLISSPTLDNIYVTSASSSFYVDQGENLGDALTDVLQRRNLQPCNLSGGGGGGVGGDNN